MTDNLKTLALECKRWNLCDDPSCTCHEALAEFIEAASPDAILALITQVEVLECALKEQRATDALRSQHARIISLESTIFTDWDVKSACMESVREHMEIAAGLRARIAELEGQEPVAWKYQEATYPEGDLRGRGWRFHQFSMSKPDRPWMQDDVTPLFLASGAAPAPAAQEPVAYFDFQEKGFRWANNVSIGEVPVAVRVEPMPLYAKSDLASEAAREPLTADQIDELIITQIEGNNGYHQFARAIEAAHGIGTQEQK